MARSCVHLTKWYGDCVTDDGVAFVGYAARLRLGLIAIPYHATLVDRPDGASRANVTLGRTPLPVLEDGRVSWRASRLGIDASWTAASGPIHRVLHEDARCRVDWRCHLPAARARVLLRGDAPLVGDGYVEELRIAGDPRRLPIRELWWGRFAGGGRHVVWIMWRGSHPLSLAWADGEERPGGHASPGGVTFSGGRLTCGTNRTLRAGRLGRTFLAGHAGFARLVPRALDLYEEKWVSRARLEGAGARVATGWAIHEVIRWP